MTDKKSLGSDLIAAGLPIVFGLIAPTISRALSGGTPASVVAATLNDAAFRTAQAVVERRDGPVSPLSVIALHLEDHAHALVVEHQPILAAEVAVVVAELRKRAAALAPTDPAPSDPSTR